MSRIPVPTACRLDHLASALASRCEGEWPAAGTLSSDRVAAIGHEGFAFLHGGGNRYYAAYSAAETDAELAAAWADYIRDTRRRLNDLGLAFAFCMVPNKATLLPGLYPFEISGQPTLRCQRLLPHLDAKDRLLFERLLAAEAPQAVFRRNDSHLTDYGNLLVADTICRLAGEDPDWSHYDFTRLSPCLHGGDLGGRYEPKAMEQLWRCKHPTDRVEVTPCDYKERKGQFVGLGYTAHNPDAPVAKRVLVFGNSFVERLPSWGASMPLAATFRDFRFIWYPGVDVALAAEWQADLVVFQTCERFLSARPATY